MGSQQLHPSEPVVNVIQEICVSDVLIKETQGDSLKNIMNTIQDDLVTSDMMTSRRE